MLEFDDCSEKGVTDASRDAGSESVAARDAVIAACCPRYVMEFPVPEGTLMATGDERIGADDPAAGRGAAGAGEDSVGEDDARAGDAVRTA